MIDLDTPLPPGALCTPPPAYLAKLLPEGTQWWRGATDQFETDPKTRAITAWRPALGPQTLHPTEPNDGNGLIGALGDLEGLQCRDSVHCGLTADAVIPDAQTWSLAVRYLPLPQEDPRTIVTVNMGGAVRKTPGENYLFVSETEEVLTVKDDAGTIELTLPAPPPDADRTVILSVDGPRLSVTTLAGVAETCTGPGPILSGAANLFVGCRNQRPRLQKTLGSALISDIWVLPGRAILGAADAETRHILSALRRYLTWGADF